MRNLLTALVLTTAAALGAEFSTKPARDAADAYSREMRSADDAHAKAKDDARRKYLRSLGDSAKSAAAAGNLDEVNRIAEETKRLNEEAAPKDSRVLWISQNNVFFQRLDDGQWVAIQARGGPVFYSQAGSDDEYVSLRRGSSVVRLYGDKAELHSGDNVSMYPPGRWVSRTAE